MTILEVIQNVSTVGIVGGVFAWLFKTIIRYLIDKDIEKYKSTLQAESQEYKFELQRITNEHSIKFSKLHSDRAIVIKEFYSKLFKLSTSLRSFFSPLQMDYEPSLKDKIKEVALNFNDASPFYYENKIYFDKDICRIIENMLSEIKSIYIEVTSYPIEYDDPVYKYEPSLLKEKREIMRTCLDKITGEIDTTKENLEENFRKMLGVS